MMKQTIGHVVYSPLSASFSMLELGGSPNQKYDAVTGEYTPSLQVTPYVLQPKLQISDPDNILMAGDYSAQLCNCKWVVNAKTNGLAFVLGQDYTVNSVTKALTLKKNIDPDTAGSITFTADFVDVRRGDVLSFSWSQDISCQSATQWRTELKTEFQSKINLSPFKNRGVFLLDVQMYNGDAPVPDSLCTYSWQFNDEDTMSWKNIASVDEVQRLWCTGGEQSRQLQLNQDYIGKLKLRCIATVKAEGKERYLYFFLRRFYGQWDDRIEFLEGKYVTPSTTRAVAEVNVTRKYSDIMNPENYFDMEIFYIKGQLWNKPQHVAYGTTAMVPRSEFPIDGTERHGFGVNTRELSALMPIASDDNTILVLDEDTAAVAHTPTTPRNI